jgi:prolyl oligopeptidase
MFFKQFPGSIKADGTVVEKNECQKLYYHRIGTHQSEDVMCAEFPDEPNWMG